MARRDRYNLSINHVATVIKEENTNLDLCSPDAGNEHVSSSVSDADLKSEVNCASEQLSGVDFVKREMLDEYCFQNLYDARSPLEVKALSDVKAEESNISLSDMRQQFSESNTSSSVSALHHEEAAKPQTYRLSDENKKSHSNSRCTTSFEEDFELEKDMDEYTDERSFSCSYYHKHSQNECNTTKQEQQSGVGLHYCLKCFKCFLSHDNLQKHMRKHADVKDYACSVCSETFHKVAELKCHMVTHTDGRAYPCPECGRQFSLQSSMRKHMIVHTREWPISCQYCAKRFKDQSHLKIHLLLHKHRRQFFCMVCSKRFNTDSCLMSHVETHIIEKELSCSDVQVHTGLKCYFCSACGKGYLLRELAKGHMLTHTFEKKFICSQCGKPFPTDEALRRHLQSHTALKHYTCPQCGKSFKRGYALKIHMKSHSNEKPFSCSYCSHHFKHKHSLKNHWKSHPGIKPYCRPDCKKTYSKEESPKRHALKFMKLNPVLCPLCDKCFIYNGALNCHMKFHKAKKLPYHSKCNGQISQKHSLDLLPVAQMDEKPYCCPECNECFVQADVQALACNITK
ncbi:hypothetical protein LSH36_526g01010 [Paralvinella palmiformis]|uniref:C2H2-type domain-containing protein n=1 Tax=Paralvinella palmiformis TaxID=53620 RepID=A0AAD9J7N5_9ANNE|nr:hypothetical protein LSH36_526g01010 [Paralvinella palmiformis]